MSSWRLLLLLAATPCILAAGQRLSGSASAALPQLPLGEPLSGRRGARQWWPGPLGVWGCSRCRPYQGPSPCQRAETKGSYWEVGKASQTPRDPVVAPTPVPSMCPCLPPRLPLFSASSLACCRPLWCPTALPSRCAPQRWTFPCALGRGRLPRTWPALPSPSPLAHPGVVGVAEH